jgi:HD-GYP domain-containing protein (c-di-GMP phosphodiesterase class II)
VHRLSLGIARELGLAMPERRRLSWAALLHDVGKIAAPEEIFEKRGQLTPEEEEQLKEHPIMGCDLLAPIPQLHVILPAIRHHHERFDGRGYPDGLSGQRIPLLARIIAVAEVFDAMCNAPPWQRSLEREEAVAQIAAGAGTRFDPQIVHALQRSLATQADPPGLDETEDALGPPDVAWDESGGSLAA